MYINQKSGISNFYWPSPTNIIRIDIYARIINTVYNEIEMASGPILIGQKNDLDVKKFGIDRDVPSDPRARLMFYWDSICYTLDLEKKDDKDRKLREYWKHTRLSDSDQDELLILCAVFSPDLLLNKCIFMDEEMCPGAMNQFYEINKVSNRFLISKDIIIAGERKQVQKILCFREVWLDYCYYEPLSQFKDRIKEIADVISGRQSGQAQSRGVSATSQSRPAGRGRGRGHGIGDRGTGEGRSGSAQSSGGFRTGRGRGRGQTQTGQTAQQPQTSSSDTKKSCIVL